MTRKSLTGKESGPASFTVFQLRQETNLFFFLVKSYKTIVNPCRGSNTGTRPFFTEETLIVRHQFVFAALLLQTFTLSFVEM